MKITLAAVLLAAALAPRASAKCAMAHLKYQTVTTQLAVAPSGGIVVATVEAAYGDTTADADDKRPAWTFEIAKGKSAPAVFDTLAPGLVVYRVPAGATGGRLLDGKTAHGAVTIGDKTPELRAPVLVKANHDKTLGRRPHAITTVTLSAPPPTGAVALVLADAKGTPRSFGLVGAGATKEIIVYEHDRCGVVPNDTVESAKGDKIEVFWVDQSGRVSPMSNAIALTGNKPVDDGD